LQAANQLPRRGPLYSPRPRPRRFREAGSGVGHTGAQSHRRGDAIEGLIANGIPCGRRPGIASALRARALEDGAARPGRIVVGEEREPELMMQEY